MSRPTSRSVRPGRSHSPIRACTRSIACAGPRSASTSAGRLAHPQRAQHRAGQGLLGVGKRRRGAAAPARPTSGRPPIRRGARRGPRAAAGATARTRRRSRRQPRPHRGRRRQRPRLPAARAAARRASARPLAGSTRQVSRSPPYGAHGERSGLLQRQEHPDRVGALLGVIEHHRLVDLLLADRKQLHDDGPGFDVPAQSHGADPELLLDRGAQRLGVHRDLAGLGGIGAQSPDDLVEQRGQALGQDGDLLLFHLHADHLGLVDGLQIERAVAGLADGARDESIGGAEDMDDTGHGPTNTRAPDDTRAPGDTTAPSTVEHPPQLVPVQPPGVASDEGRRRRRRLGGTRARRSSPQSLTRWTNGRVSV